MIVIFHQNNEVVTVELNKQKLIFRAQNPVLVLTEMALAYPQELLVWCHIDLKLALNYDKIPLIFHHQKIMVSYNLSQNEYLPSAIGYIEESPFIKINKKVTYPTWQMSSLVGGIRASLLLEIDAKINQDANFDYYLISLAKLAMPKGLLCYSEPSLLKDNAIELISSKANLTTLFRFVKQHYKTRWVFILFLDLVLYERKFPVLPLLNSLFFKNRNTIKISLDNIEIQSTKKEVDKATVDVIIPTIGRKKYLYDVLKDLAQQTHLPKNVIIVEQNPLENSVSELDYLTNQTWPFRIKHTFIHQAGACNARNLALHQIENEWVFLADDDIRFDENLIRNVIENCKKIGTNAASINCLQNDEKLLYKHFFQWQSFGSGCSFVKTEQLKNLKFSMSYEFGFGEDSDFGMQLRNSGCDVLYLPEPTITHLKAPIGGFRTKPKIQWHDDEIQPKPSPTVMLYKIKHNSTKQILGYKTVLFFKYYKHQKIKNPFQYFYNFQKQWEKSVFWANKLNTQNEI